MEELSGYASSPERALRRPPPPIALEDRSAKKRSRKNGENLRLPAVLPVTLREDKYLVHVHIPIEHPQLPEFVRKCMAQARLHLVGRTVKAAFEELADLHVSIARPATVRSAQIGMLVKDLKSAFSDCERFRITLQPSVLAFANKGGHRVFMASPVASGPPTLLVTRLIRSVDRVFQKHGLPLFFEEPKPHMSFAWTEKVEVLPEFAEDTHAIRGEDLEVPVDSVVCRVGKSSYKFTLR